jgi:hypothetical protein
LCPTFTFEFRRELRHADLADYEVRRDVTNAPKPVTVMAQFGG